uniref:Peptidase S1 domain-containing protein n=1 Tax=Timema bartmani TaxID=61472 RepID=A0A7R9I4C9_9NEOP|nr:unnamed protein product [Timema bartmani]
MNSSCVLYDLQVSLKNNGLHFCGGALISLKHVLTAGHCVVERRVASQLTKVFFRGHKNRWITGTVDGAS